MTDAQSDGFLNRWSRLKTTPEIETVDLSQIDLPPLAELPLAGQVEVGTVRAEAVVDTQIDTQVGTQAESEKEAERLADAEVLALTDADMPDIETLGEDSDFSGFLSEKVSAYLRRKALQKLFHLPEFNLRDGLNEYDEDYSTFVPLGDTITYQMKQFIERQKQDFKDALEDDPDAAVRVDEKATTNAVATEGVDSEVVGSGVVDSGEFDPELAADAEEDDLGCCE